MKSMIVFVALLAIAFAKPVDDERNASILRSESDNIGIDGYNFEFDTSNGISRQEAAKLENAGTDDAALAVHGTVSWVAPDGQTYSFTYIADKDGYRAEGAHIVKS